AGGGGVADMSGTPHYMAPEQLTGEGASLRSDVYALGLVLHEMLTGKRVFEAKSLNELRALHAETKPPSLSTSARDVDPGLERVVLRCLARDPNDRPASARIVLASLPGGDPLQAALLAGETPSPEMVAAASKVGDLRPAVAWACLISGLLGLVLVAGLCQRAMLYHVAPLTKPPEALVERAKEVLSRLGYREAPADEAYGFEVDREVVDYARREYVSPDWWRSLGRIWPGPYRFYYRQSQALLWSQSWILTLPNLSPAELGRVTRTDPPLITPGMKEIVLDAQGRLVSLVAVPPRFEVAAGPWAEPDWRALITESGFDPQRLRPVASSWAAPVDSDRKAAWDGASPEEPEVQLHFEAASYRGRPVYFEVKGPWVQASSTLARSHSLVWLAAVVFGAFLVAVSVGAAVLVRRNLRLGRGDRRGAFRLAQFGFVTLTLAHLFRADHTSEALPEFHLILQIVGQALSTGMGVWLTYMALEPAVRRRWPDALISWSRLLAGRYKDPIVGRDVLVGVLAGLAIALQFPIVRLVPAALGWTPLSPQLLSTTLSAPWHMAFFFFLSPVVALTQSLLILFFLYLLLGLFKRAWAALLVFSLFFLAMGAFGMAQNEDRLVVTVATGMTLVILMWVLVRFGLFSSTVLLFTFYVLVRTPMTLDWSAWYAGRSFAVLGFFAALMVASFYTSLGGKPMFGKALQDD
ncbi:MAG: protein kinase, partial [Vicinamibacteria bacterium]|nr:protein kinase [Vicinamibacteria bacterium]